MLEHYPSDLESSLAEPLQGFGSFSLPPGLYAPEAPNTIGAQATIQTQQPFLDQLQTQVQSASCLPVLTHGYSLSRNFLSSEPWPSAGPCLCSEASQCY